jgi:hypothetical protein
VEFESATNRLIAASSTSGFAGDNLFERIPVLFDFGFEHL